MMTLDKRKKRQTKQQALDFLSYRLPMLVTELLVYSNNDSYYVCPRCHSTLDRDFLAFCDRCGQCLNWKLYKKAKIIYPGKKIPTLP